MNRCDSAGNKNKMNFSSNFFAAVTPTINGRIQKIFIFINFMTKTMAKNDSSNLFLKNFSEIARKMQLKLVKFVVNSSERSVNR